MNQPDRGRIVTMSVEVAISLLLIFLLVAWCLKILAPFVMFILWGAVIAISVHSPFKRLREKMGNKAAVTIFSVLGLGLVLIPAWMFGGSLLDSTQSFYQAVESGTFTIPPPADTVREWPLVGEKLFGIWSEAAINFEAFLEKYSEQMRTMASMAVGKVAGLSLTVLMFLAATLIAALMLSNDTAVVASLNRFSTRLLGNRGEELLKLTTATVRSVTVGVLGIALIQAIGTGAGMFMVGVPGAGIWALLVLIMVIAQLPALLIMAPIIVWVFSVESTTVATIFAIWSVAVSMSDVVLKPMLLGRGVEAPMVVILLGAIGGMIMSGIIGLFVGAVVLAVGYKMFQVWLAMGEAPPASPPVAQSESINESVTETGSGTG